MTSTTTSNHKTVLIIAGTLCVIACGLYAYMYYSVNAAADRAATAQAIIQSDTFDRSNAEKIKKLYQSTTEQRANVLKHVIPSTNIVAFIETFESVGSEAGSTLKLSGVSAGNPKDVAPAGMGLFHAHVEATGSWSSVMQTLMLTENLPFVTLIDSVSLDNGSGPDGKDSHAWHVSFNVALLNSVAATSSPQK